VCRLQSLRLLPSCTCGLRSRCQSLSLCRPCAAAPSTTRAVPLFAALHHAVLSHDSHLLRTPPTRSSAHCICHRTLHRQCSCSRLSAVGPEAPSSARRSAPHDTCTSHVSLTFSPWSWELAAHSNASSDSGQPPAFPRQPPRTDQPPQWATNQRSRP
jgi:hypothetical protein